MFMSLYRLTSIIKVLLYEVISKEHKECWYLGNILIEIKQFQQ